MIDLKPGDKVMQLYCCVLLDVTVKELVSKTCVLVTSDTRSWVDGKWIEKPFDRIINRDDLYKLPEEAKRLAKRVNELDDELSDLKRDDSLREVSSSIRQTSLQIDVRRLE